MDMSEIDYTKELKQILSIPDKSLSQEEFRGWIDKSETMICERFETHDRHSSIGAGFQLEQAVTPGIYTRELTMTAGSLVFSKIHMETHPFVILSGKVAVYDGEKIEILEAPYKGVTAAGTKRVLFVHEETKWVTFHPTSLTDLQEIDKSCVITCDTFDEFEASKNNRSIEK
tara:strand:- start:2031 stop:2546 length:516 start_codon:yes stop_codon:yes gene_type:complete